jgi:hypothetical protein
MKDPHSATPATNPHKILKIIRAHFQQVYQRKVIDINELDQLIDNLKTHCSQEQLDACKNVITEITTEKVSETIKSCGADTAPGPDGIPYKVWKILDPVATLMLTDTFNEILDSGRMPDSMTESTIVLIPKKDKDTDEPGNLRPISLTNTDYKIFTKIIYSQIVDAIVGLIPGYQTGFVPGRDIKAFFSNPTLVVSASSTPKSRPNHVTPKLLSNLSPTTLPLGCVKLACNSPASSLNRTVCQLTSSSAILASGNRAFDPRYCMISFKHGVKSPALNLCFRLATLSGL